MKIGFDAKRAFNNNSGLGNYSRFLISELSKKLDVVLFTPRVDSRFATFLSRSNLVLPRGFASLFPSLWRSYWLTNDLLKQQIDIYHGLSNELPFGVQKKGVKTVVTIHDLIFKRFPKLYNPIDVEIYDRKFRRACETADGIVAISQQTKDDIVKYYKIDESKITVIYQDCMEQFSQKVSDEELERVKSKYGMFEEFVLCVGTIEVRKNQLAIAQAIKEHSGINLVLVGRETDYKDEIESFIKENHMAGRVKFIHDADFNDFPAIYSLAKVFVYPSIFEGFGIPVIEAQHCGVPVITSKGSCLSEAGGDGAVYIDPYDISDIESRILDIWNNIELQKELRALGFFNIKRFAKDIITRQYLELYESLVD